MNECINLKHAKKENLEMIKHFSKEIPKQTNIRSESGTNKLYRERKKGREREGRRGGQDT